MTDQLVAPPSTFWTLDRVADALGPLLRGNRPGADQPLSGVATDTRQIQAGQLFVALKGENFDAHDFLKDAVARGAAALVISRFEAARGLGVPVFHVENTLAALGALGAYRRRAWGKPVIAVAGSNGKTTTRELIRAALASRLEVHATTGNLNNLVGVPLTLLAIPDHADVAVVELGTNQPGEVERLRVLTQPTVAVLTSIGEEHLEGLGSMATVLREETSVFDGVMIGILPASEKDALAIARQKVTRVVTTGFGEGDVNATVADTGDDGAPSARIGDIVLRSPLPGMHNLRNALLAVAGARECGITDADAARGISAAQIPGMRSAVETLGRAKLINDAYNANPGSMRAALDLLDELGRGRPRVAILGTMLELGAHTEAMHAEIAERALRSSIDVIAGVGAFAAALQKAGGNDPRIVATSDVEELWKVLEPKLAAAADAVILLKGSRGMRLERLVPMLRQWSERQTTAR